MQDRHCKRRVSLAFSGDSSPALWVRGQRHSASESPLLGRTHAVWHEALAGLVRTGKIKLRHSETENEGLSSTCSKSNPHQLFAILKNSYQTWAQRQKFTRRVLCHVFAGRDVKYHEQTRQSLKQVRGVRESSVLKRQLLRLHCRAASKQLY